MLTPVTCTLLLIVTFYYADAQTHCSNGGSCSVNRPTCYARQYYYYSQRYTAYYRSSYYYSYYCGWYWWWYSRCYAVGYSRRAYTAYRRAGAYRSTSSCCSGYSGSPGYCTPICSGSYACQNRGTCVRPNTCCCLRTGYTGSVCNTDCDECQLNFHGCEHGCVNVIGSYTCTCRTGYELNSNQRNCDDINECSRGTDICQQVCHNTQGSYYCSCNTGYFLDANGYSCHDINECATNMGGCEQRCVNTPGGFHCTCNSGYTLNSDGITCTDNDECATNNGGCEVHCTNTPGSFECSCDDHEILDATGLFCVDHDECATGAHNCEQVCRNTVPYWSCGCYAGYSLRPDNRTCQDINECLTNNGGCQHTCTNSIGSYTCSCNTGFTLDTDNHRCIDIDECSDPAVHGCQHNCVNTLGSYHCTCNPGYTLATNGRTCTADPCAYLLAAPEDGTISCTGISTDDNCTFDCDTGFSLFGEQVITCQPNHQWSAPQPVCTRLRCDDLPEPPDYGHVVLPCSNAFGQTCYIDCDTGYQLERGTTNRSCIALPPAPRDVFWTIDVTTFCGDIDECQVSNGGCSCEENIPREAGCFSRCNNTMGSFYCICTPGFILEVDQLTCQDHNECALTDHGCEHQCVNTHGTYMCVCDWGYRLDLDMRGCSDIDECSEGISGCNQTCTNIIGNYSCSCESELYTLNADGHACDDVDECLTDNGGCDHYCHNYYGGHSCSCRPGYTLQDDGFECVADPCEPIMAPQNGSIACTSGMVGGSTDDNCTFSCHLGFNLENSNHRTCLPDHTWSGAETYCRILQCPNLLPIPDSSVRLPCAREFTSFCTMDCNFDYYLVGNSDRLCLVVNNVTNEVGWVGQHAECDPIRPCSPTPCLHNARCFSSGEDYFCDCRGTGYTGDHCEIGKVEFPINGFSTLLPGMDSDTITIFASPDDEIFITPSANNCTFAPAQINITAPDTNGEFNANCWGSGAVTVNFMLDGTNAENYATPPPLILYIIPGPRPMGEVDVFERLSLPVGTLPPAALINTETVMFDETEITLSSSSGWCRDGDIFSTTGIVYIENDGFTVPTALQGATVDSNTLEVQYTDPAAVNESCSVSDYSANDIQDFISQNALANQYFDSVSTLFPSWLEFAANPQNNIASVSENEFVVNVEPGSEVVQRPPCSSLPIETENLCVVLPYTGSLEVIVGGFNITFESQNGVCFVSSVIGGANSPFFIGGFDDETEQNALSMLDFMEDLTDNGWNVELGSIGLGNSGPVAMEMSFDPFRTSFGMTTDTLPIPDVWMNGNVNKQFGSNSASRFNIELNGDAYLDVPDLATILDGPPSAAIGQWTCVATGSIGVNVNFQLEGEPLNLTITGTDTQILSIFGGFPRDPITNPAGIFFRGSGQLSPSLFNQYSSDIDVYITLNENNEATGLGCIITGCIYITESLSLDNLDIEISTFNWSTPTDNPLWFREGVPESQFYAVSRPEQEIALNNMITILSDNGTYTEPSIIMYYPSTAGGSYTGYCYSRVSVFGATIDTTVATIGDYVYISSPGPVTIFDSYPAYLWCRATLIGAYSWDELRFEITGYFDRDSVETTLLAEVTQTTWDSIVTMANVSKQRHVSAMEALDRADEALSATKAKRTAAQIAYNASVDALAAARANVTRTNETLNRIRQEVGATHPQVNDLQSLMNNLCVPIDCPTVCLPSAECLTCTENIEVMTYRECDNTCYEDVAREVDPGTIMVDCWEPGALTLPQIEASCEWRSSDYIDYGCRSRRYNLTLESSQPSRCSAPALDYPYTADTQSYDCQMACQSLPQIVDILYTCCSMVLCGMQLNPAECLLYNQACRTYRNAALTNGTHGTSQEVVTLLTMEADAEQDYNAAVYSKMIARQMVNMAEEMLYALEREYNDSLAVAISAQSQLNNITYEVSNQLVVYDYLQSIPDNTNLEIKNISFISFQNVSDPNALLELSIEYEIGEESDPTYIEDRAFGIFDFSRTDVRDLLVYDLMSTIAHNIAHRDQTSTSKRDVNIVRQKRQQIIDPGSNPVLNQFHENCLTLQNAEETLEDLITSLGQLNSQYQMSYNSLWNLMNELVMLQSNYSASGIGRTMFVDNATYINDNYYKVNTNTAQQLGIDVMAISSQIADSMEMIQAREVIDSQLNVTRTIMQNLGRDIFEDWSQQIRSMILGAQTDSCYSFHDCSSLLINEIRNILASTPADLVGPLRDSFEQTAQEFLEVTSINDLTIAQAYNRSIGLAQVIARLHNISYWCVVPPNITEQPRPFGALTVGQFYFISCAATGSPAPTYTWWKDGEVIPGATNTTLYFNALTRDDEGTYTCVATNLVHSVRSMPAIVKVETIPSIISQPEDVDAYVCSGNGAVFQVNATGIPVPRYQWYFRHIYSTIFDPIPDAVSSVFFIAQPRPENEGTYYCNVSNSRGSVITEFSRLHLLQFEVTRLSALVTFDIHNCSRSSAEYVYSYNSVGSQPVDYSTAFYEVVVEALDNLTDINLLDPLNFYREFDISERGGRIEIDIVTPSPDISDSDCVDIITIAEYLTTVSAELNMTLTTFRNKIENILFRINGVAYCIGPQPTIRPDVPLCPARGGAQFGGVLCPECPPGSYQTEDRDTGIQICKECPKGTYQTEIGQTQCISCPPNRTTEYAGTRSDSRCFLPCEPGYISVNGLETAPRGSLADCRPCGVGYYQPDSEQRYCIQCPDGENTSSIASTKREQCIRKCDPGCVSHDHGLAPCQKCQKGQYIGFMQSTFCFACPEGQSTLPFENSTCGATSIDDCRTVCLPGSYSTDQTGLAPCEKCGKDFYQTAPDQSDCIPCDYLYGTLGIGTSREEDCLKKCGPGNYSQNGFEPCTLCAQGEYQEDYEQYECIKCPPGTTTGYTGTRDKDHCVDKGQIPSDILPDPFPTDMDPENVPAIPQKVSGSKSPTSSTHDDRNRIIGIAVGVSVAVLVVIGIILVASMIYFRTRGSDPITVKHRELSEDKAVLWTSGTGNLRVEPTNRLSRISTATDGFSNPVYSMEDAISTCENDEISGDLVHNPVYIDDDMLQHDSALTNPLFQDDDVSMENSFYDDEVDQK